MAKNNNNILKNSNVDKNFCIYGDTHRAELDKHNLFANSGFINYNTASYITLEESKITLTEEKY